MQQPGERRPDGIRGAPVVNSTSSRDAGPTSGPRSRGRAIASAVLLALAAAAAWALLRGILELGPSLLAVSALGGWGIGKLMRAAGGATIVAVALAATAWLLGLIGTWLVSMALLPGSSRTFAERLEATPFVDWMSPQLGLLEVAGLLLYGIAAAYGARTRQP